MHLSRRILAEMLLEEADPRVQCLNHLDDATRVPEIRHGEEQKASGFQHARNLPDDRPVIGNMLCGFGADGSVECAIVKRQLGRVGLCKLDIASATLRQSEIVKREIDTVDPLPHCCDLAGIARIRTASNIENRRKAAAIVASHPDNYLDNGIGGAKGLDSGRQNLSTLLLVVFTAECHRAITENQLNAHLDFMVDLHLPAASRSPRRTSRLGLTAAACRCQAGRRATHRKR